MLKKVFLFCVLLNVVLCQYPYVLQKNTFPHLFVLTESYPNLTVHLDYYFEGFNLSYNFAPPPFEATYVHPFRESFHMDAIEQIQHTSARINGKQPQYAILKDNKVITLYLEDDLEKHYYPLSSVSETILCFDLLATHDANSLFLLCHDSKAKNTSIVYRVSVKDGKIVETHYFDEAFVGDGAFTERQFKDGHVDIDSNYTLIFYFYLFSLNRQSQEWLIQEFIYSESDQLTFKGNNYTSTSSVNNTLENLYVTDFVGFEKSLVLYDHHEKALINFNKKTILSSISLLNLSGSSLVGSKSAELIAMSGDVRYSDFQEQVLLNFGNTVYHFSITSEGDIVEENAYIAVHCETADFAAYKNNEIYIVGTHKGENRLMVYEVGSTHYPVFITAEQQYSRKSHILFPYQEDTGFFRANNLDITFFKRNPQDLKINQSWVDKTKSYELVVTSHNSFAQEASTYFEKTAVLKIPFKVIFRKSNDKSVEVLERPYLNTVIHHPGVHTVDLDKIFHGPALNYTVDGIDKWKVKNTKDFTPTLGTNSIRTLVDSNIIGDLIIFQETPSSNGTKIRVYIGENIDGDNLTQTFLTEFNTESPVTSIYAKYFPNVLFLTHPRRSSDPVSHADTKLYSVNLRNGTQSFGKVVELTSPTLSFHNCSQLHFSEDPFYPNHIFCLNSERQEIVVYSCEFNYLTLEIEQRYKVSQLSLNAQHKTLVSLSTHSEFSGVLVLKFGTINSDLEFFSWELNRTVSRMYIGTSYYALQGEKLLTIDYSQMIINVYDLCHLKGIDSKKAASMRDKDHGITGNYHHTLDLFGCRFMGGSIFTPRESDHFYIKAHCPTSNLTQLLVYSLKDDNYEYLVTSFPIENNKSHFSQISVTGGLFDTSADKYDLISVNIDGDIYYHAVYYYPHVVLNSSLLNLTEKVNTFHISITAASTLSQEAVPIPLILYVAKFQTEITNKGTNHSELLPLGSYLNHHEAHIVCFGFDPSHLWQGNVLEITHRIELPEQNRSDFDLKWQVSERYKVYNKLFERISFQAYDALDLKIKGNHIYYLSSNEITIAPLSDPERSSAVLSLGPGANLHGIHICDKEDCIVGISSRDRINYYVSAYTISNTKTITHVGDIKSKRQPSALAISSDGLVFTVTNYNPAYNLMDTYVAVFDIKNLQRNWSFAFQHINFMTTEGDPIGFQDIIAIKSSKQGEYLLFITNNATGLMGCKVTVSENVDGYNMMSCQEYNFNQMIKNDLVSDDAPYWHQLKFIETVSTTQNTDDAVYRLLVSGLNTPIYIVEVSFAKEIKIIQGFINYHQTGTQVEVAVSKEYVVSYVTNELHSRFGTERNSYIYLYQLRGGDVIKMADDSWTLEEALVRMPVNYRGIHEVSALDIDPVNNTVFILDKVTSQVSVNQIAPNATICIHENRTLPGDLEYDFTLVASNDLNSQQFKWHVTRSGASDQPGNNPGQTGGKSFWKIFLILLGLIVVILICAAYIRSRCKGRTRPSRAASNADDNANEIEPASSYRPLQEL